MKKTYIKPETIQVEVDLEQSFMAGSTTDVQVQSDPYDEGTMTDLSRRGFWDDEEE